MSEEGRHEGTDYRLDEAISWHVRLAAGDAAQDVWQDFAAWLEADPANRLAFDRVEDLDAYLTSSADAQTDTISLAAFRAGRTSATQSPAQRLWIGAAAGLIAASLVVAFIYKPFETNFADYTTRIGETKSITLADGSRIDINTDSRLLTNVNTSVRQVTLERGEALFHVAKDAEHPFYVTAGDRTIRVVGTIFDVLNSGDQTTVTVAEGRVAVSPERGSAGAAVLLLPGEQLVHDRVTGMTEVSRVNPEDALAWKNGYLVYRDAPLSKVVGDLNRYFPQTVTAADTGIAMLHFSGVLRLDDERATLERISKFLPVSFESGPHGTIVLHASKHTP
jgi:transmembrane sensor